MVYRRHGLGWVATGEYLVNQQLLKQDARLGPRVMSQLFYRLVRPMATIETMGAFLNGLRVVVIDGTTFDVPDSDVHSRVFGRPSTRPGTTAAFALIALGDLDCSGNSSDFRCNNRVPTALVTVGALKLLRSVLPGMLLMWDRGLHSYKGGTGDCEQGVSLFRQNPRPRQIPSRTALGGWVLFEFDLSVRQAEAAGLSTEVGSRKSEVGSTISRSLNSLLIEDHQIKDYGGGLNPLYFRLPTSDFRLFWSTYSGSGD